jgi:hypothetical protein
MLVSPPHIRESEERLHLLCECCEAIASTVRKSVPCVSTADNMTTSPLAVVSYISLLTSSVLHLVAFSTDYWLRYTTGALTGTFDYHLGLWNTCYRSADTTSSGSGNETITAVAITPWFCANTHSWLDNVNNG